MAHYVKFKRLDSGREFLLIGPYALGEIAEREGKSEADRLTKLYGQTILYELVPADTTRKAAPVSA
jgi:hypothetical protein